MLQPDTKLLALSWQELICRLDGVYAANVVLCEDDTPKEIHILASYTKSPKSLTRDVQSALMAAFNIDVDYRIISIAQIHPEFHDESTRLCYAGIDAKYFNGQGSISVYLSCGDSQFKGEATYTGRNTSAHLRGVALATLNAITQYISNKSEKYNYYDMISSEIVEIGGMPVNIVTLCDDKGKQFIGSSFIKEHHDDAVVRSVLDALNRRICKAVAV